MAQQMSGGLAILAEQVLDPFDQLAARLGGAVAVADLQMAAHQIAQQSIWLQGAARVGAAEQQPAALSALRPHLLELAKQPALAQACVAHHRDSAQRSFCNHGVKGSFQPVEFAIPPNHAGLQAFNAPCGGMKGLRPGSLDEVAAYRCGDALDADRRLLDDVEHAAHMAIGVVADAQAARRSRLLHARRQVNHRAPDAAVGVDAATQQHGAGVDAGTHVEVGDAVRLTHLWSLPPCFFDDAQACQDCALGIVLVGLVGTEGGQHAVARELEHAPTICSHDCGEAFERAVHHFMDVFRLKLLAHRCRAHHIDEQHRHLFQLLACRRFARAHGDQCKPQRRGRGIDHGITQQRSLRFERGDRRFYLLGGVVHESQLGSILQAGLRRSSLAQAGLDACDPGGPSPCTRRQRPPVTSTTAPVV